MRTGDRSSVSGVVVDMCRRSHGCIVRCCMVMMSVIVIVIHDEGHIQVHMVTVSYQVVHHGQPCQDMDLNESIHSNVTTTTTTTITTTTISTIINDLIHLIR